MNSQEFSLLRNVHDIFMGVMGISFVEKGSGVLFFRNDCRLYRFFSDSLSSIAAVAAQIPAVIIGILCTSVHSLGATDSQDASIAFRLAE
jgi:hypothetical protein